MRWVAARLSRKFAIGTAAGLVASSLVFLVLFAAAYVLQARILFAGSLYVASGAASDVGEMSHGQISVILSGYALAGLVGFAVLALTARGRGL